MITDILATIGAIALGQAAGSVLGWATTARRDGNPFHWRVFLGPWAYYAWLER